MNTIIFGNPVTMGRRHISLYSFIVIICIFVHCITPTMASNLHMNASETDDYLPVAQPFVDILISDYFRVERILWQRIDHRADNILLQVYRNHEQFLDRVIGQSGSGILGRNLIPDVETLTNIVLNINSTAELGQTHLKEQTLDKKSITEFASTGLKILKEASSLYEYVVEDTMWQNIILHLSKCHGNGDTVQSSHQVIYDFYRDIQSSFLKSYITAQMSYMILGYYTSGENYSEQVEILRTTFQERFNKLREIVKRHLHDADKIVWKCDTVVNNVFTSCTEISNFLQGIVDNEANLNSDASCAGSCSDYRQTHHYQCQSGSLCDRYVNDHDPAKCNGVIRHCQEIDDTDVNICETGESNRRYHYIRYSDGRTAGNLNTVCHGRLRAESWIRWFVRCSNCICLCDDIKNKRSERYFSLREVVSNIADNKIVTGIVLTKQNGIVHMAIAERTLLPYGLAETTSAHGYYEPWKSSYEFFNIDDTDIQENVDYVALTYENRSINLDMVTVPKGHLVSGVRFRITNAGHITLDVRATSFDFITGKLKDSANSMWVSNPDCGQTQIILNKPSSPLNFLKNSSQINETPNAFIKFGPTDYWSDVSQLTVPFIDTQRIEPYQPIPLSGIGLYHKTVTGSGGFIAPKLIVSDYESYILDNN